MEPESTETAGGDCASEKRPSGRRVALAAILLAALIGACLVAVTVASKPAQAPGKAVPSRSQPSSAPSRHDAEDGAGDGEAAPAASSEGWGGGDATASEDAPGSPEGRVAGAPTGEAREGGGSSSNPAPTPTPAPNPTQAPHEHSWTPVTAQQWVANNVWVEDSPAWDEPVYGQVEREICNTCGADVTGFANQHLLDSGRGGCSSWRSEVQQVQTGTIHHDATGHYEDRGHYETVTTGYSCSCGATR